MVKKPDIILDEIHAVRKKILQETANMTITERTAYFTTAGEAAAKKYGFNRITLPSENLQNEQIIESLFISSTAPSSAV